MTHPQLIALKAMGQLETHVHELSRIARRLEELDLWQPSHGLAKQAAEARAMISDMQSRLDQELVVTLIGPSGAGKSTLLNALAGIDGLSPIGLQRPTTRNLFVLAKDTASARRLFEPLSSNRVHFQSSPAAESLSRVVLVDTPDTDSTQSETHLDLLYAVIERSDVLICVFDAQNPKRRDHIDFLAPMVSRFHGASLMAVINKCDRLTAEELSDVIKPDFQAYLNRAWDSIPKALFLISARSHLQDPQWDAQAPPRNDTDQYDDLKELIFKTYNQAGFGPDRRLANAAQLIDFVRGQIREAVDRDRHILTTAHEKMNAARQQALVKVLESLRHDDRRQILGVNVRFYQALAQRWLGPVGWLVAVWSRLTIFGSGLTALVRFGNPLAQVWGLIATWQRYRKSKAALAALEDESRVDRALQTFNQSWQIHWPDIAELLIQGRFHPQVRRPDPSEPDQMGKTLDQLWSQALDKEIDHWARRLSHPLLQILFNMPSVLLFAYVGWLTAIGFFSGHYLSSDFFVHALLTIAIVLLLSFFLLQVCARVILSRDRIQRRTFSVVEGEIETHPPALGRRMADQVEKIFALGEEIK